MDIKNVTNQEKRRLDLVIPVSYSADIDHVKEVLNSVCMRMELVLQEEPIQVMLMEFAESSINMGVRVWVNTEDYWPLKWELLESIKKTFDSEQIAIPFNQLDVTIVNEENPIIK